MSQIVTRFAPSPTGYLHIGGARTALFNWLYARGKQAEGDGKFLLRIEDTDRARHNQEAVDAILDGLSWLGIDWDGDPISQFSRAERHADIAHQLLETGAAYRCWLSGDELTEARDIARAENRRFESPWRDFSGTTPDEPFAIRLKAPQSGNVVLPDLVQSNVTFSASQLDDMVLLRSDGTPTYMLAVVVDDHDMGISHIIRGDDHLINGARQLQLYNALDWNIPAFAHIPLIHGQDGAKLSKRHGALGVEAYRDQGYLSQALMNYLLRLGWAHGDDEIIPEEKAKEWFDISGINKAPARLDLDKLNFVNSHYIKQLSAEEFIDQAKPFLDENGVTVAGETEQKLLRAADTLQDRVNTLAEVASAAAFVLAETPYDLSGKARKPLQKEGALDHLQSIHDLLDAVDNWNEAALDELLQKYAADKEIGFGVIGPPLRTALTGGNPSPSLGKTLFILGKNTSLQRICDQLV